MVFKDSGIQKLIICALIIISIISAVPAYAENPIIQTKFTADPAPMVYKDTVFLYTSHDEDDATGFHMLNWMLYTTTDMVNWTDHGIIAGVGNGNPVSHEYFKASKRKAFHGLALVILQSAENRGDIKLIAASDVLKGSEVIIKTKN